MWMFKSRLFQVVFAATLIVNIAMYHVAFAAWAAEDNFDSYTSGNSLDGGAGGTGWAANWTETGTKPINVTNTQAYQGANSVFSSVSTGDGAERQMSADISGAATMYVAMRRSSAILGSSRFDFRDTSDNNQCEMIFNASGNVTLGGASPVTLITGYSADTWYAFKLTINGSGSSCVGATTTNSTYQGGGTWSANSGNGGTRTSADTRYVLFDTPSGAIVNNYWDYISPTDPLPSTAVPGFTNWVFWSFIW